MNRKLVKNPSKSEAFIESESGFENIQLNGKINFLVGKNNSGKTRLVNHINNQNLLIEDDGKIKEIDIVYISNDNNNVEYEIKNQSSSIFGKRGTFIHENLENFKESNFPKTTGTIALDKTGNESIDEFNSGKTIEFETKVSHSIKVKIDTVLSSDSGSGTNRMYYISYLRQVIYDAYKDYFDMQEYYIEILNQLQNKNIFWRKVEFYINNDLEFVNMESSKIKDEDNLVEYFIFKILKTAWCDSLENMNEAQFEEYFKNFIYEFKYNLKHKYEFCIDDILNTNSVVKIFDILKNGETDIDLKKFESEINLNEVLIIIDEPEKFLHMSMMNLFREIVYDILKIDSIDIKFLFITHSEKIVKTFKDHLENLNIAYKNNKNEIEYYNLFDNNIHKFIEELNDDYEEIKRKIENNCKDKKELKNNILFDSIGNITKDYLQWFLTSDDNIKLFYTDKVLFVEGWHEWIFLTKSGKLHESSIIKIDGLHNMPIFTRLLSNPKLSHIKANFLIDVDTENEGEELIFNPINKSIIEFCNSPTYKRNYYINSILRKDITELFNYLLINYYSPINISKKFKEKIEKIVDFGRNDTKLFLYDEVIKGTFEKNVNEILMNSTIKYNKQIRILIEWGETYHQKDYHEFKLYDIWQNRNKEIIFEKNLKTKFSNWKNEIVSKYFGKLSSLKLNDLTKKHTLQKMNKFQLSKTIFKIDAFTKELSDHSLTELAIKYLDEITEFSYTNNFEDILSIINFDVEKEYLLDMKLSIKKFMESKDKFTNNQYVIENERIWEDFDLKSGIKKLDTNLMELSVIHHKTDNVENHLFNNNTGYKNLVNSINVHKKDFFNKVIIISNYLNYGERMDDLNDIENFYIKVSPRKGNELVYGPIQNKQELISLIKEVENTIDDVLINYI